MKVLATKPKQVTIQSSKNSINYKT